MTVRQALTIWLQGPRRLYGEGLELFRLLSSQQMKVRYLAYFEEVRTSDCTDVHLNILVDKLSRIMRDIRITPALMKDVLDSPFTYTSQQPASPEKTEVILPTDPDIPLARQAEKPSFDAASLPSEQRQWYGRIRDIVPLMAKLHADLSSATSDEERKRIADDLCSLDDERRKLWDLLDSWKERTGKTLTDEPDRSYSDNGTVRGLEMARRRKRLKDNIRTTKMSIARFEKNGQTEAMQHAKERLEHYISELDTLERMIADEEKG